MAERRLRARTRARAHARTHARHPQTPRPPHRQEGATTIAIEIVALDEELDTADVLRAIMPKVHAHISRMTDSENADEAQSALEALIEGGVPIEFDV